MKTIHILSAGLLAIAGIALLAPEAKAQLTYKQGDLFLGFEEPGNSNAGDYLIDIGPASYILSLAASPGSTNITTGAYGGLGLGNFAADLATEFSGTGWATNYSLGDSSAGNAVQWGIIGATSGSQFGLAANTLFETQGETTPGTQSTPITPNSSSLQSQVTGAIAQLGGQYAQASGTGSSSLGAFSGHNDTNSWSSFTPSSAAFNQSFSIEQPSSGANTGATDSTLDFYEVVPNTTKNSHNGSTTDLGTFTLDSSGDLIFTSAAAVPEPSTYAMVGLGAMSLLGFRRFRRGARS